MFPFTITVGLLTALAVRTETASLSVDDDAMHSIHQYNSSRDYLHITSENYPATYPAGHSYTWEWTAQDGHWGVYFEVFDLVCYPESDALIIIETVSDKKYVYTCQYTPSQLYFQSSFSMKLMAKERSTSAHARGFKCHVFYAETKAGVEAKINEMKVSSRKPPTASEDDSPVLSGTELALILIIVLLILVVSVAHCVIKRLRQHHQHNTNTSITVSIDSVRRDSSVSYTRSGVARLRFDSQDDGSPVRAVRPKKRSESNASWAQRATTAGSGTVCCASKEQRGRAAVTNHYTPLPVPDTAQQSISVNVRSHRVGPGRVAGNVPRCDSTLSAISEESSEAMLSTSCQLQEEAGFSSASDNSGYVAMTGCSTDYINCGRE